MSVARDRTLLLEDNAHSRAEKSRCVRSGCVRGMNGNLYIRSNLDALCQTKAIKRLKNALVVLGRGIRFTVIKRGPEHISPASEWMNLRQPDSIFIPDGRSGFRREGESSKGRPAISQFMVELDAAPISASSVFGIVSPHANAIKLVFFAQGA